MQMKEKIKYTPQESHELISSWITSNQMLLVLQLVISKQTNSRMVLPKFQHYQNILQKGRNTQNIPGSYNHIFQNKFVWIYNYFVCYTLRQNFI